MPKFDYEIGGDESADERLSTAAVHAIANQSVPLDGLVDRLSGRTITPLLGSIALGWAKNEIDTPRDGALALWRRYESELGITVPSSLEDLVQKHPGLIEKISRLFIARQQIIESDEQTPDERNAGETMHLVLVPWAAFSQHRKNLPQWLQRMRSAYNHGTGDEIRKDIVSVLGDSPRKLRWYRRDTKTTKFPLLPFRLGRKLSRIYRVGHPVEMLTAGQYLDRKVQEDGDWGVILTQTSDVAGLKSYQHTSYASKSADELTHEGSLRLRVAGHIVDGMGIFEWLAASLQVSPRKLSAGGGSMLLANRIWDGEQHYRVPVGRTSGSTPAIVQHKTNDEYSVDTLPRLTVL